MEAVCYINNRHSKKVVVQSLSPVWFFATPWTPARQASLFFTISRNLLKLMSIESVMPSNHLILCRLLLFLPSIFPCIRVFSTESTLRIRWPEYWLVLVSNSKLVLNLWGDQWFTDLFDPNSYLTELFRKWNEVIHIILQSIGSARSIYSNKC